MKADRIEALVLVGPILTRYQEAKEHALDPGRIPYHVAHLMPFWHAYPYASITPELCAEYHRRRRAEDAADGTIRGELLCLRTALRWAGIQALPRMWIPEENNLVHGHVPADALDAFLEPLPGYPWRVWTFINIAVRTSARTRRVECLTWPQVDMKRGTIDFRVAGDPVSTKKAIHTTIHPKLRPVLEEAQERSRPPEGYRGPCYVLGNNASTFYYVKKWAAHHGMPELNRHSMRHTFAQLSINNGADPGLVALAMGCDVRTVMHRYVHSRPEYVRGVVESF